MNNANYNVRLSEISGELAICLLRLPMGVANLNKYLVYSPAHKSLLFKDFASVHYVYSAIKYNFDLDVSKTQLYQACVAD
jgi:hypothetical protein